jgi:hypothetical protein
MVVLLQGVLVLFGKLVGCPPFPSQMIQLKPFRRCEAGGVLVLSEGELRYDDNKDDYDENRQQIFDDDDEANNQQL